MTERGEIREYEFEFIGENEVDVPEIQATSIIRSVLESLNISFDEIKIKSKIQYTWEFEKMDELGFEFPKGEPDDYYVEGDLRKKMIEVGINDHVIRIPLNRILLWFSEEEDQNL